MAPSEKDSTGVVIAAGFGSTLKEPPLLRTWIKFLGGGWPGFIGIQ